VKRLALALVGILVLAMSLLIAPASVANTTYQAAINNFWT